MANCRCEVSVNGVVVQVDATFWAPYLREPYFRNKQGNQQ